MLSVKHLIDTNSLTRDDIQQILDTAQSFEAVNNRDIKKVPALRGRTIVNLFLEPSTRTRSSMRGGRNNIRPIIEPIHRGSASSGATEPRVPYDSLTA